jgi:hypothetical protein
MATGGSLQVARRCFSARHDFRSRTSAYRGQQSPLCSGQARGCKYLRCYWSGQRLESQGTVLSAIREPHWSLTMRTSWCCPHSQMRRIGLKEIIPLTLPSQLMPLNRTSVESRGPKSLQVLWTSCYVGQQEKPQSEKRLRVSNPDIMNRLESARTVCTALLVGAVFFPSPALTLGCPASGSFLGAA